MPATQIPDTALAGAAAAKLTALLDRGPGTRRFSLTVDGGESIPLPADAVRILRDGLADTPTAAVLSLAGAAAYLNLSPEFVAGLLDAGTLPSFGSGPDRTVPFAAATAYRDRSAAARAAAMRALVAEAQALGMGY